MKRLCWGLSLLCALGCERRVDEPSAPDPEPTPDSTTKSAPAPMGPPENVAELPPDRCVEPTPDEPERPEPPPGPDPDCPDDPGAPFDLDEGQVRFAETDATVSVEIASEHPHRRRGLMYRKELGDDEGMLFVFERRRILTFWMKNTCLPLDMIFIDEDGLVVGIEENVPTLNERTYAVRCPARYVLEVPAGWAREHGVVAGSHARFEGVP